MMHRALLALAGLAGAGMLGSAHAEMISPAKALQKAISQKGRDLARCGVRWRGADARATARFTLGFDGKLSDVRIEGLAPRSPARACIAAALSEVRVPTRLAFIVREVSLPLPIDGAVAFAPVAR